MTSRLITTILFFTLNISFAQEVDSIKGREIIQTYLNKIGGLDKVEAIKSIRITEEQPEYWTDVKLVTTIVKNDFYCIERIQESDNMKSFVHDGEGVNITSEGIFSMSEKQVHRYTEESRIVAEVFYLSEECKVTYNGLYQLDEDTQCHEVAIKLPNGKSVFNEYNVETGLLELSVTQGNEERYLNYTNFDGLLLPSEYEANQRKFKVVDVELNPEIDESFFRWNAIEDEKFIGRWEAMMSKENNIEEINYIELKSNRSGRNGIGVKENGKINELGLLNFQIVGWEIVEGNIKLNYYDSSARKLHSKVWIILEASDNYIKGYIEDPELSEMFGDDHRPIILEYLKVK